MSQDNNQAIHWADMTADRIIKQCGDKESYTLASGITPSGVVHFGNFREVITVDFVARALREKGKKVRFIFSWDDYDTFRKVPANLPKQDELPTNR
jgi:lysyl-tRNA synthetase class 1